MNSSTSSSSNPNIFRLSRPILRSLLICIFLLTLYQTIVSGGILPPSDGISQWQTNVVKIQRYVYQKNSPPQMILVGSSITNRIKPEYISSNVENLALSALSSQTGLEVVKRSKSKPSILLVEINDTISREKDDKMIYYVFNHLSYYLCNYFPMFRQEYQPVSVLIEFMDNIKNKPSRLKNKDGEKEEINNPKLTERLITQQVKARMKPLSKETENNLRVEAEYIKTQVAELKKEGVRVVLFDVPGEERVKSTIQQKQVQELMQQLFPKETFEWLPEPPSRDWITNDGIHLVDSNAKKYGAFLKEQLAI